ncbi:hypothetical protein JEU11_03685 [Paraglaciecola chathamensis]|uniref:Uncharacterized protein n=1 Tax=Paraglaciecola chathamensis TaxID=368405 RepID=A0ABS0WAQ7_9ALTE|nr:hypothetical protein [Paraglaciecola chathamensis]MBJ2135545.1 hypothetical protein [Paraglaciecola chathamensis]
MHFQKYCPSIIKNRAHASTLQKSLGLKLNIAQTIVSHMYGCHNWAELNGRCDQEYEASDFLLPIYYLEDDEISSFRSLLDKFEAELGNAYKSGGYPPDTLLALIVNNEFQAIEHYQIEQVLNSYSEYEKNFDSFMQSIGWAENSAHRVINTLSSWKSAGRPINLWLHTSTYQQSFYAYYKFSDINDDNILIRVEEWDTGLQVPSTKLSVCNKPWYIDYMIGYLERFARQFIVLGYQPTFEFFKIQNTPLSKLESAHERPNHPKNGVYKLAQRLLMLGGALNSNMAYHEITAKKGIRVRYSKESFQNT